jgi:hypothetical protein
MELDARRRARGALLKISPLKMDLQSWNPFIGSPHNHVE